MKRSTFLQSLAFLPIVGTSLKLKAEPQPKLWTPQDIKGGLFVIKNYITQNSWAGKSDLKRIYVVIYQIGYNYGIDPRKSKPINSNPLDDLVYTLNHLNDGFTPCESYSANQLCTLFNAAGFRPATKEDLKLLIDCVETNFIN